MASTGEILRAMRLAKGLTQVELAAQTGRTQQLISLLERDHIRGSQKTLNRIVRALGVSSMELEGGA